MRSAMTIAFWRSCVTCTVVMPSLCCNVLISCRTSLADAGIQVGQGLVEQQHLRADRQRAAERHTLSLPAGKGSDLALAKPVEPQHRQQLVDARADLGAPDMAQLEIVTDVLHDRHMRPQGVGLEHHRNAPPFRRQARYVLPADENRAAGQADKATNRARERGLATARCAQKRDKLAAGCTQRHAIEHPVCAIEDARFANLERYRGRSHREDDAGRRGSSPSSTSSPRKAAGVVK